MVKVKLFQFCTECKYPELEIEETLIGPEKDVCIRCKHENVCYKIIQRDIEEKEKKIKEAAG